MPNTYDEIFTETEKELHRAIHKSMYVAMYATLRCMQEHYYPWGIPEIDDFQNQLEGAGLLEHSVGPTNDNSRNTNTPQQAPPRVREGGRNE